MACQMGDRSASSDQSALLGTALAAVLSLYAGGSDDESWNAFNTLTGIMLLLVLIGYYQPGNRGRIQYVRSAAFASVSALCLCIATAWPLQIVWAYLLPDRTCKSNCVAKNISDQVLPCVWLLGAAAAYVLVRWYAKKSAQQSDQNGPSNSQLNLPAQHHEPRSPETTPTQP